MHSLHPREIAANIRRCRDADIVGSRELRTIWDTLKAMNILRTPRFQSNELEMLCRAHVMKNSEVHARMPKLVKNLQFLDVWLLGTTIICKHWHFNRRSRIAIDCNPISKCQVT